MVMIGRESVPQGAADDELLLEAESLAGAAMRTEPDETRWRATRALRYKRAVGTSVCAATKKGRIAPPLLMFWREVSLLAESAVFLVADEAELGDARTLDDVEHLGRKVVAGFRLGLELQFGLDCIAQRCLQVARPAGSG